MSAIAGVFALSQFDNHNVIAGLFAIIVAALTAVTTFLNPNERANSHLNAGNKYDSLRNKARIFCEIDTCIDGLAEDFIKQLKNLANQRDDLNQNSTQIPTSAFKRARKGIEDGEADYKIGEYE